MSAEPSAPPPENTPAPGSSDKPGAPPQADAQSPGLSGCIGLTIGFLIIVGLWLGLSFALFSLFGETAGAAGFFIPVLGFFLWKMSVGDQQKK